MSKRYISYLFAAALVLAAVPAFAQTSAASARTKPRAVPADIAAAQQFVLAAYPELLTRPLTIRLKPTGDAIVVSVEDPPTDTSPGAMPAPPLVTAAVAFDAQGQLVRYQARGVLLDQTRNDMLTTARLKHPEWADSDVDIWITAAGGPTTVTGVPPSRASGAQGWQTFLGTGVRTAAPAFNATAARVATSAAPSSGQLTWVTQATANGADGSAVTYRLEFEPFGGRLVAVTRQ